MKRKFLILTLIMLAVTCKIIGQQIISLSSSVAKISFANAENANLTINLEPLISENGMLFSEDFSLFPLSSSANAFGGQQIALTIPYSYTGNTDCRAKTIYNEGDGKCYFFSQNGIFQTPLIDFSNRGFRVSFDVISQASQNKSITISLVDSLGNTTQIANRIVKKNTSFAYDTLFPFQVDRRRVSISSAEGICIDNLNISSDTIYTSQNDTYNTTDTFLVINNLKSNTSYKLFITGRADTITFTTPKALCIDSISQISDCEARVYWGNYDSVAQKKILVSKKSSSVIPLAKDLFFSEYILTSSPTNKAVEIYNGTGKSICLKDYCVKYSLFVGSSATTPIDTMFCFGAMDTIYNNSCVVITEDMPSLTSNNGVFYKNFSLRGFYTMTANDAIILMKNGQTIDIIGSEGYNPGDSYGWTDGAVPIGIKMANSILQRKDFVNKGVRQNPINSFPTLATQWNSISHNSSNIAAALSGVGKHNMNGAAQTESFDSIVAFLDIPQGQSSILLASLEEGTLYQVSIVSANDTVALSQPVFFTTASNTQRLASGVWNDTLWSKGEPSMTDNAIITSGQIIEIPQNLTAQCKRLIIKDTIANNHAQLRINGTLETNDSTQIYYTFGTQSMQTNTLFGLPVNVSTFSQDQINSFFTKLQSGDSLFSLSQEGNFVGFDGVWKNGKGYLLRCGDKRTLVFEGIINNEDSYSLLEGVAKGYYLLSNPYSFALTKRNIQKQNISMLQVLDQESQNFIPLQDSNSIAPYGVFAVYVSDTDNYFVINKTESSLEETEILQYFSLAVSSQNGNDKTTLFFKQGANQGYSPKRDNLKINGLGKSPEICFKTLGKCYYSKTLAPLEDSLLIDVEMKTKQSGTYTITMDTLLGSQYEEIVLINKASGEKLVDFMTQNNYTFSAMPAEEVRHWQLRIKKTIAALPNISVDMDTISVIRDYNRLKVKCKDEILELSLIDTKGVVVATKKRSNEILIPHDGIFILSVQSQTRIYRSKIIIFN